MEVEKKIEFFALHREAIILDAACQRTFFENDLRAIDVEEFKHLIFIDFVMLLHKSRQPCGIHFARMHLH